MTYNFPLFVQKKIESYNIYSIYIYSVTKEGGFTGPATLLLWQTKGPDWLASAALAGFTHSHVKCFHNTHPDLCIAQGCGLLQVLPLGSLLSQHCPTSHSLGGGGVPHPRRSLLNTCVRHYGVFGTKGYLHHSQKHQQHGYNLYK